MRLTIAPNGTLEIDDARIIWKNFRGIRGRFNHEGERGFTLVIPDENIADILVNDKNRYGKGWNVRINPPKEPGDDPFMYLKVKIGTRPFPRVHLRTGKARILLNEETIGRIDEIDIEKIDLNIVPSDGDGSKTSSGPYRAAYLESMEVYQRLDRFDLRYEQEQEAINQNTPSPDEVPFN